MRFAGEGRGVPRPRTGVHLGANSPEEKSSEPIQYIRTLSSLFQKFVPRKPGDEHEHRDLLRTDDVQARTRTGTRCDDELRSLSSCPREEASDSTEDTRAETAPAHGRMWATWGERGRKGRRARR